MKKQICDYINSTLGIDDAETIEMLFSEYIQAFDKHLNLAIEHLDAKNFAMLRKDGHTIKGCSANIGAEPMRQVSYRLEKSAEAELETESKSAIDELKFLRSKL